MENLPEGFFYMPNFINEEEEKELINMINTFLWHDVKMYGQVARRKVMHFGLDYTYESRAITPTTPAPNFLDPLISKCASWLKVEKSEVAEILITQYPPQAGIGWHRDAPVFDKIVGISLLSCCPLKLRLPTKKEVKKINLDPRSAYMLCGQARTKWQHAISPVKELRYSITLRTLRKSGIKT